MIVEILGDLNEAINNLLNNMYFQIIVLGAFVLVLFVGIPLYQRRQKTNFFVSLKDKVSPYTTDNIDLQTALKEGRFDITLSINSPLKKVSFLRFLIGTKQNSVRSVRYGGAVIGSCNFYSPYKLSIRPKSFSLLLLKGMHFMEFTPTGDALIDRRFYISTNDIELTKKILQDEELRKLILTSRFLVLEAQSKKMKPAYPLIIVYEPRHPTSDEKQNFNILIETKVNADEAFQAFLIEKRLAEIINDVSR